MTVTFQWSEEHPKTFQEVKNHLSTALILQPPDFTKPFYLWVDASMVGYGVALKQEMKDVRTAPVAFASKSASSAE